MLNVKLFSLYLKHAEFLYINSFTLQNHFSTIKNISKWNQGINLRSNPCCSNFSYVRRHTSILQGDTEEILYGIHPVVLALSSNRRKINALYYKEKSAHTNPKIRNIVDTCKSRNILCFEVNLKKLNSITNKNDVHQGVCLHVSKLSYQPFNATIRDCIKYSRNKLFLYLDQINDPMNLGAILRTAHFFGVDEIFANMGNRCPISNTVSKASSGVAEIQPVYEIANEVPFFELLRKNGWQVIFTSIDTSDSVTLEELKIEDNAMLVIGNEGQGIRPDLKKISDVSLTIRAHPNCSDLVQCLNVSVASAVIIHSLKAQINRKVM